jgi:hypothetical protein
MKVCYSRTASGGTGTTVFREANTALASGVRGNETNYCDMTRTIAARPGRPNFRFAIDIIN